MMPAVKGVAKLERILALRKRLAERAAATAARETARARAQLATAESQLDAARHEAISEIQRARDEVFSAPFTIDDMAALRATTGQAYQLISAAEAALQACESQFVLVEERRRYLARAFRNKAARHDAIAQRAQAQAREDANALDRRAIEEAPLFRGAPGRSD